MTVEVVAPLEFQGSVIGAMNQRKGTIVDTEVRDDEFTLSAEVALNDMFGYASQLRGMTQGKGEFAVFVRLADMGYADGQVNSRWSTRSTRRCWPVYKRRWLRTLTRSCLASNGG